MCTPCPSWHWCCVNDQRVLTLLPLCMNIGQFKIVKKEMFWRALYEGRLYTGRYLHQIWAEWAVHGSCYLLKDSPKYFNFMEIIWSNALITTPIGQNSLILLHSISASSDIVCVVKILSSKLGNSSNRQKYQN